jgi:hypothetical protein
VETVDYHQEDLMAKTERLSPIHPGEILYEDFMKGNCP